MGTVEYYRVAGDPTRPSLVFMHEGLGCAAGWGDYPRRLCEASGCRGLIYSRFGYGGSSPAALPRPVSFMHDEAEHVLPALLDHLEVRAEVLVGHSDGGSIALLHAGKHDPAGRVRGLILEAPHLFVERICVERIAGLREEYRQGALRERLMRRHGDRVDEAFGGWVDVWLRPEFRRWNIESALPGIRCPVVAFQGNADPYGTLEQVERLAAGVSCPIEVIELDGCGHQPHREAAAVTLARSVQFLAKLPSAGE
ncbi:hypothetical protein ABI59_21110 [Acidobacteria bacterium Mor1]|nr:hypothetical protein ABI59_21110 [Acidobacteria bacterium Mor1]